MYSRASNSPVNILLVDDQPGKLLSYEAMLGELGENLFKASSGDEALQLLLKKEFAVVLVDVCMPNIDGFELASLIRQHPRCQKTSIIFISAVQVTQFDHLRGYEHGAVDYLSVPVVPELLRARVAIFADLHRKTAALERMNEDLERRVTARTRELELDLAERKRLEDALLDAGRRKDEFLAVLAHELRNPLAPIRTAVDIMGLKRLEDPALLHCRDVIERQVEHLTRLVDDLMDVSRITRGKITLDKAPLDIAAIVGRAVETQRPAFDARRQQLTVQLPPQALWVEGDLTRLSEAIGNLLNNAAKYTDEGGLISLRVEARSHADGTAQAVVRVKDSGVGIPPAMLPKVFELFTQVDHTLHRAQGGLGIGLALVRKLVEMHGGTVEGFSEGIGRGSEFVLSLPLRAEQRAPQVVIESPPTGPIAYRRILVVDDNRDAAQMLAAMLRFVDAEIEVSHDGPQALAKVESFRPDLVLLDIGMPGMSGLEVAQRIRALPSGKNVLLVAQTGWGQEADRQRTRAAGFDDHLIKPIDHAKLMHLMTLPRVVRTAAA